MRKFILLLALPVALASAVAATVIAWRRNPRLGTRFVNVVVNPGLVRRGFAGRGRSEIGSLEHVGRRSGLRRVTPVHPEPTTDGFRIMVPLGEHSEWASNVLSAGHCRLQLHDCVYDLDEPALIPASEIVDLPPIARRAMTALGFEYLTLRTFAMNPGTLERIEAEPIEVEPIAAEPPVAEPVDGASAAPEPEPIEAMTASTPESVEPEQVEEAVEPSPTSTR